MVETCALVDRWVEEWADSRRMSRRRDGGGWFIEVAAESRTSEYIIAAPSMDELRRMVAATTRSDMWLTIVGYIDEERRQAVSPLDPVTEGEQMMMVSIRPTSIPAQVLITEAGRVANARIELEGVIAARGQAAVRGVDVVFDRIETTPAFRRRGLGGNIMAGLTGWAANNGASTGLLMASVEGHKLYQSLGMHDVAPITTFRGRGA